MLNDSRNLFLSRGRGEKMGSGLPYCHLLREETSPDCVMPESRNQNSNNASLTPELPRTTLALFHLTYGGIRGCLRPAPSGAILHSDLSAILQGAGSRR